MTAEILRLVRPMQSPRRTDPAYIASQATYCWLMIGMTTTRLMLAAYSETLRLYGLDAK